LALPQAGELLTFEQVAEILDVPPSTVAFRWKKARLYLARELKRIGVEAI
jgi:DNA-directed RNA polymerase specialized sigma24 family protein